MRPSSDGDCTVPGQIALQRIPWRTKSIAIALVKPTTAALELVYTKRLGTPRTLDAIEDMLTMLPRPARSMPGRKARQVRYIDRTLRSKENSQSSSLQSRIVPWWTNPAQLNKISG